MPLWGGNQTFYASCVESMDSGESFVLFGIKDNVTYIYSKIGDGRVAAIATPPADGGNGNATLAAVHSTVHVWYSVGTINRCGSFAVVEILAANGVMELTAAGKGVGFCGAQFRSDGIKVNVTGSNDATSSCEAIDSVCIFANDTQLTTSCTAAQSTFTLPAAGRKSATWTTCPSDAPVSTTFPASAYPGGSLNTVDISEAGETASIYFGLDGLTAGVMSYNA